MTALNRCKTLSEMWQYAENWTKLLFQYVSLVNEKKPQCSFFLCVFVELYSSHSVWNKRNNESDTQYARNALRIFFFSKFFSVLIKCDYGSIYAISNMAVRYSQYKQNKVLNTNILLLVAIWSNVSVHRKSN